MDEASKTWLEMHSGYATADDATTVDYLCTQQVHALDDTIHELITLTSFRHVNFVLVSWTLVLLIPSQALVVSLTAAQTKTRMT